MSKKGDHAHYPLPEALTRRVVSYLNAFRLLISLAFLFALFAGLVTSSSLLNNDVIAGSVLISYLVMAAILAFEARGDRSKTFFMAQVSLFIDVLFLTVLLFILSGLENGVAILLIFASASAAMLLPMRLALVFASLVVLAFFSESLTGILLGDESLTALIQAGLYGITTFVISILVYFYTL